MKAVTSLIFIAIGVALFFWYVEPAWATASQTRAQISQYNADITAATQAEAKNAQLLNTYNSFNQQQLAQLQQFLPTSVDPINFILSLNTIAAQYGSGLASVTIGAAGPVAGENYNIQPVTFSVAMTYPNFLLFLKDLERSLPVTDITSLTFTTPDTGSVFTFTVNAQTYYLQ